MQPRIVTLTMNPAVDVASMAASVRPTHKIRTFNEQLDPGGGGINVAKVLRTLGADPLALIMTGGVTGRLLQELLDQAGIRWRALPIHGRSRISLNIRDQQSGLEYRFIPEGPLVEPDEWHLALDMLRAQQADWIVASGSLPRGVPDDFYAQAAAIAAQRGQNFALDTSGAALRAGTGTNVALLKSSLGELEFLTGRDLADPAVREKQVLELVRSGVARMIAVSLGRDGAILVTAEGAIRTPALQVEACGTVGAGDSFLAGLVMGLARGLPHKRALALATAAGGAAVLRSGTAPVRKADVERFYRILVPNEVEHADFSSQPETPMW